MGRVAFHWYSDVLVKFGDGAATLGAKTVKLETVQVFERPRSVRLFFFATEPRTCFPARPVPRRARTFVVEQRALSFGAFA
jgi:hypothetical protein